MFTKNIFETNLSNASFRTEVVYSDQNEFIANALVTDGWNFVGCVDEAEVADVAQSMFNAKSCRKVEVSISFTEVTP